jgi:hypothetical protein
LDEEVDSEEKGQFFFLPLSLALFLEAKKADSTLLYAVWLD